MIFRSILLTCLLFSTYFDYAFCFAPDEKTKKDSVDQENPETQIDATASKKEASELIKAIESNLDYLQLNNDGLQNLKRKVSLLNFLANNPERPLVVSVFGLQNSGVSSVFNAITNGAGQTSQIGITSGTTTTPFALVPQDLSTESIGRLFYETNNVQAVGTKSTRKSVPDLTYSTWSQPFVLIDVPGINNSEKNNVAKTYKFLAQSDVVIVVIPRNYTDSHFINLLKEIHSNGTQIILTLNNIEFNQDRVKEYLDIFSYLEKKSGITNLKRIIINNAPSESGHNARQLNSNWFGFGKTTTPEIILLEDIQTYPRIEIGEISLRDLQKLIDSVDTDTTNYLKKIQKLENDIQIDRRTFEKNYDPKDSGIYHRIDEVWQNSNLQVKIFKLPIAYIFKILEFNSKFRHKIIASQADKDKMELKAEHKRSLSELSSLRGLVRSTMESIIDHGGSEEYHQALQTVLDQLSDPKKILEVYDKFIDDYKKSEKLAPGIDKRIKVSLQIMKRDKPMIYYTVLVFGDYGYRIVSTATGIGGPAAAAFFGTSYLIPVASLGSFAIFAPIIYPLAAVAIGTGSFFGFWALKSRIDHAMDYARVRLLLANQMKNVFRYQMRWRRLWLENWLKENYLGNLNTEIVSTKQKIAAIREQEEKIKSACKNSYTH